MRTLLINLLTAWTPMKYRSNSPVSRRTPIYFSMLKNVLTVRPLYLTLKLLRAGRMIKVK
jgi:hypothetical protein